MPRLRSSRWFAGVLLALPLMVCAQTARFEATGLDGGARPRHVSADGSGITGFMRDPQQAMSYRWTSAADGQRWTIWIHQPVKLGTTLNEDGSLGEDVVAQSGTYRFHRVPPADWQEVTDSSLTAPPPPDPAIAVYARLSSQLPPDSISALTPDGKTAVGRARHAQDENEAFRWTETGGMQWLGMIRPQDGQAAYSLAAGVSDDGQVVIGDTGTDTRQSVTSQAFRWTATQGIQGLGFIDARSKMKWSTAVALSRDGSVVVGSSRNALGRGEAFRWTAASGMQALGMLRGDVQSAAELVSADGNVVIGISCLRNGDCRLFRWSAAQGMQSIDELLARVDAKPEGWILNHVLLLSANGQVMVGKGKSPQGKSEIWAARIPLAD